MSETDTTTDEEEIHECVSILEYNENAPEYGEHAEEGKRVIIGGVCRDRHVLDEEDEDFVKVADGVAIIELHQPISESEVNDWCNSPAGKLALAHWFDHADPKEVVMT